VLDHEVVVFAAGSETESVRAGTADLFRDQPMAIMAVARREDRAGEEPITR
jgi:hypothetical protein